MCWLLSWTTRSLPENGYLEKTEDRKGSPYRITDKERPYLAGELDASDLEVSDESE